VEHWLLSETRICAGRYRPILWGVGRAVLRVGGLLNTLLGPEETDHPYPSRTPVTVFGPARVREGWGVCFLGCCGPCAAASFCWGGRSGCCLFFENYTVDASIFISLLVILNRF
jgi:hypothetical protein